jgi:peptidoglycan/xylan/chitin deacetylase (PgdA/CDA1 family)
VITFDDGFQNNYDICFPILREAGLPATVFLCTGYLDTGGTLWFCRLNRALANTTHHILEWNGVRFDLRGIDARTDTANVLQEKLKELPHPRLLEELSGIALALGDDPECPMEAGSPYRMLNSKAIADMSSSGTIEFGAHTHTHAILSKVSPQECADEIDRSVDLVSQLTGRPCELFAYPNGRVQDYTLETMRALEASGVRAALTTIVGPNTGETPVMELRRYGIGPNLDMAGFQMKVHHITAKLRRVFEGG